MRCGSVEHRHAQRGGQRVEHLAAPDAAQIDQIAAARWKNACRRASPIAAKTRSPRVSTSSVGDDELSKSGLSEVLEQQLRVAPAQIGRRRLFRCGRPAKQLPERRAKMPKPRLGAPRRADEARPPSAAIAIRLPVAQMSGLLPRPPPPPAPETRPQGTASPAAESPSAARRAQTHTAPCRRRPSPAGSRRRRSPSARES